jgi:hypothetical protein
LCTHAILIFVFVFPCQVDLVEKKKEKNRNTCSFLPVLPCGKTYAPLSSEHCLLVFYSQCTLVNISVIVLSRFFFYILQLRFLPRKTGHFFRTRFLFWKFLFDPGNTTGDSPHVNTMIPFCCCYIFTRDFILLLPPLTLTKVTVSVFMIEKCPV